MARLRADGVRVVMLTGDRKSAADAVAEELGIAEVRSALLPEDKVAQVERLLGEGAGTSPGTVIVALLLGCAGSIIVNRPKKA